LKKPSDEGELPLRDRLIGLGEHSLRKSYYPELRERAAQLERFRVLLDESQDGILLLETPAWTIVDLNDAGRRAFTGGGAPVPGARMLDVVSPLARPQLEEGLRAAERGAPAPFTLAMPGQAGDRYLELAARLAAFDRRTFLVLAVRDVTQRMEGERALRESEKRFRALFEHAPDAIFLRGPSGQILDANPEACRSLGYTHEELLGMKVFDIDRGARNELQRRAERAVQGPITFPGEHRRRDGTTYPVEVRLTSLKDDGEVSVAVVRDISERVRMEDALRAKERELLQSQKMEAIGQLAGGVAHDFNNLLTAMIGYTELILEGAPPGDPIRDDARELLAAARRAADLTRQLLAFGRKQILLPRVVSLNEIVAGLERMLRRLIAENIALETDLAPDLWPVLADPGQIEQVIVNLAVNARDAMARGGTLRIGTRNLPGEAGRVEICVADTGVGMDADTQARVFEPFFTTKDAGKGTGLGLATVYGIVRQSGGEISVESEKGKGTTFRIALPRTESRAAPDEASAAPARRSAGQGTILVVEDDAGVRKLIISTLQKRGYIVVEAADGAAAERACSVGAPHVDLVLCDVVLPGLGGVELADQLSSLRPGMRVLFMSGYNADEAFHDRLLDPAVGFIAKPFSQDALLEAVELALEPSRR